MSLTKEKCKDALYELRMLERAEVFRITNQFAPQSNCDVIEELINEHFDNQPKVGKWISIEDRLPDKPIIGEDGYIVQMKHVTQPFSAYWDGKHWTDLFNDELKDIIAWMPLPELFKE